MSTKDMTLQQFVASHNIGEIHEVPLDAMLMFGHNEESAASVEIFMVALVKKVEEGEMVALAGSYLVRLGYKDVAIQRKEVSTETPKGFPPHAGCTHLSTVTGVDPDQESIIILVSSDEKTVSFTKQPVITP